MWQAFLHLVRTARTVSAAQLAQSGGILPVILQDRTRFPVSADIEQSHLPQPSFGYGAAVSDRESDLPRCCSLQYLHRQHFDLIAQARIGIEIKVRIGDLLPAHFGIAR